LQASIGKAGARLKRAAGAAATFALENPFETG
jgi:hypothetical protein